MLKINLNKVFRLRGITKPGKFLVQNGFSESTAYNIIKLKTPAIKLENLNKLCSILSCTPNDLLEWTPDKNIPLPETHPLQKLKPSESLNLSELLKDVPAGKISEFKSGIEELKTKLKQ
jgi:DNA-binding Xre family transcriptional regulator